MNIGLEIVFISIFFFCFYQLSLGMYVMYTRRKLTNRIKTEKTRTHFAVIRNDLMNMVVSNKIDANGILFKKLYQTTSFIMRRPDQYKDISNMIAKTLFVPSNNSASFQDEELEIIKRSKDIKLLLQNLSKGFSLLIIDYSLIRRAIIHIEYHTGMLSNVLKGILFILRYLAECEERKKPEITKIGKVQKNLQLVLS